MKFYFPLLSFTYFLFWREYIIESCLATIFNRYLRSISINCFSKNSLWRLRSFSSWVKAMFATITTRGYIGGSLSSTTKEVVVRKERYMYWIFYVVFYFDVFDLKFFVPPRNNFILSYPFSFVNTFCIILMCLF